MSNLIRVDGDPSINAVAAHLAQREYDWTFGLNFSILTPQTVEECVGRVMSGSWRMIHIYVANQFAAMHYLHDTNLDQKSAWVSGYLDEETMRGRGGVELHLKRAVWEAARVHFTRHWGFQSLHGYCLASNEPGIRWVREGCLWHCAGRLFGVVSVGDKMVDIEMHTQRKQDIDQCQEQAESMFGEKI